MNLLFPVPPTAHVEIPGWIAFCIIAALVLVACLENANSSGPSDPTH